MKETGVKIRGWEPLKGRQGTEAGHLHCVLNRVKFTTPTLLITSITKKENGISLELAIKLKKKNKRFTGLTVGSFVEVPGPTGLYSGQDLTSDSCGIAAGLLMETESYILQIK